MVWNGIFISYHVNQCSTNPWNKIFHAISRHRRSHLNSQYYLVIFLFYCTVVSLSLPLLSSSSSSTPSLFSPFSEAFPGWQVEALPSVCRTLNTPSFHHHPSRRSSSSRQSDNNDDNGDENNHNRGDKDDGRRKLQIKFVCFCKNILPPHRQW